MSLWFESSFEVKVWVIGSRFELHVVTSEVSLRQQSNRRQAVRECLPSWQCQSFMPLDSRERANFPSSAASAHARNVKQ
jgi:hypothetical protein